ncbi:hypothetical protein SUGI_0966090 [Cryptomeria japonica]|nr:hypothetical protein SUGI_0966090 [Cryptomeria japonica]
MSTIDIFKKEYSRQAKVWDREKIVMIPDQYIFTRNVDIRRDFSRLQEHVTTLDPFSRAAGGTETAI